MQFIRSNNFTMGIKRYNRPLNITNNYFVEIPNNSPYTIILQNFNNVKADAIVTVNGENVGVWRLNPHTKIEIGADAYDGFNIPCMIGSTNHFRFFSKNDEYIVYPYGLVGGRNDNGFIEVTFKPSLDYNCYSCNDVEKHEMTKHFYVTQRLERIDYGKITRLRLKLVLPK